MEECEYLLMVWKDVLANPLKLSGEYWEAHVTGAYAIPRIGDTLDSSSGLDDFNRFKVFEVRHNLGGGLAELVTERRSYVTEVKTPEGRKGLIHVLAYKI